MKPKITYSKSYDAKRKRIKRIPRIAKKSMFAAAKKDAYALINEFRTGIAHNSFRLQKLKSSTIAQKRRKGYRKPATPLYGVGEGSNKSYMNMMRVNRQRNGWRVQVSRGMHHSGTVSLKTLFNVHEYGTIIRIGKRVIRIPPRPAFRKAYERMLRRTKRTEPTEQVSAAIQQYINHGSLTRMRQVETEMERQRRWDEG